MGADIHIWAEQKLNDGTWAMCNKYEGVQLDSIGQKPKDGAVFGRIAFHRVRNRHYGFFGALAGVRCDGPEPRGLPPDVSPFVQDQNEYWDSDGHSHSWYTLAEFVPIFMEYHLSEEERASLVADRVEGKTSRDLTREIATRFLDIDAPMDKNGDPQYDRIRFVFWFDN